MRSPTFCTLSTSLWHCCANWLAELLIGIPVNTMDRFQFCGSSYTHRNFCDHALAFLYIWTNFTKQNPSWEASRQPTSQEFSPRWSNPKFNVPNPKSPVRILVSSFHDIHFNIILPFTGEHRNVCVTFRSYLRFVMYFCFVITLPHSSLSFLSLIEWP